MTDKLQISRTSRRPIQGAFLVAALLGLSACASTGGGGNSADGIGFREARFQEVTSMRDYRQCRDQGYEMDRKARASGSAGAYLASARVLEKCDSGLSAGKHGVAKNERMHAYALAIQNHFKGGDIETAHRSFEHFKGAFPDHDLYYPDGASFIVTMQALLGQAEPWTFGEFAALNVNPTLKSEMRRMRYWKRK
ncbi:MAG: hypothetical protein HQ514_06605 [Rhodospirillales bacterium]|nr:hypothetical protein [Rhodospirillales bacterium]